MVKSWDYGDAGDRWPVKPGDIWQAGAHVLACGDLERGSADELLQILGVPDITYTDPPWNAGNAKSFRTKANVSAPVDFQALLLTIFRPCAKTKGLVFREMGKQHVNDLPGLAAHYGGVELKRWSTTYYRKHSTFLSALRFVGAVGPIGDYSGMDDERTPVAVFQKEASPGQVVFDPCMGRGLTCRAAHARGMAAWGVELHPRRLAVLLDWLATSGVVPEKCGELQCMRGG